MSVRSWLGALICFWTWLLAHRFSSGWAAPSFLALCLGCLYVWFLVLRVPKLAEEMAEALPPEPAPAAPPQQPEAPPEPAEAVEAPEAPEAAAADGVAAQPMSEEEIAASYGERAERAERAEVPEEQELLAQEVVEEVDDEVDAVKAQELRQKGNEHFKAGKLHDAREAYSEALHLSPLAGDPGSEASKDRAVLHCNRAACLQRLQRWEDVVKDCSQAIQLDPSYVKAFARRSTAYEELQKWHDSFEDLKKAVELDPTLRDKESRRLSVLEKRAQEQFEKDKDEMLSKLKDLGNTVLGKFGMSTDNFKLEQDPDTGSYSIKFQS